MMNYNLNSFVNKNEAEALKEMIFQRVRERSKSMTENVQADVMDVARKSFTDKSNPFSKLIQNNEEKIIDTKTVEKTASETVPQTEEPIGFPQRVLKPQAIEQNRLLQEQMSAVAIQNTMEEARAGLSNKKSFMGALNFLNTQAAVSLLRTKADKFEVVS